MENSNDKLQWYDNIFLVLALCALVFPIGLYALWKNKDILIPFKIMITVFIVFIVIKIFSNNSDENLIAENDSQKVEQKILEENNIDTITSEEQLKIDFERNKENLLEKINKVEKFKPNYLTYPTFDVLKEDMEVWGYSWQIYDNLKDDSVLNDLCKKLKSSLITSQNKHFPSLRLSYKKALSDALWEEDGYVEISGSRNVYITIINSLFVTNKNIAYMQEHISPMANLLRFKQVRYKWYRGDNEYTSYTLTSKSDSEELYPSEIRAN